jgi:hypothetical protein
MPRKKRTINDLKVQSLARGYTEKCVQWLGAIAQEGQSESARVSAIMQLLDRGWGKAPQPITGKDGEEDIRVTIRTIIGKPE